MGILSFVWWLPAKILDSATSSLTSRWKKSHGSTRRPARRRPLHTCGASCLAMAQRAAAKAQDLDAPLGPMAKRSISVFHRFCPFARATATRSLALLIVVDDRILAIEGEIEAVFPRSAPLFDRIDGVVRRAETLPENLDAALRKFPTVIHQFPLLDWVVARLISLLNFLLSILIHLGSKSEREKEITVDVNCKTQDKSSSAPSNPREHTKLVQFEQPYSYADAARNNNQAQIPKSVHFNETEVIKSVPTEVIHLSVRRLHSWKSRIKALEEPLSAGDSPMYSSYQSANSSPVSDCSQDENHHPFTYKEILEKEKEGDDGEREEEEGVRVEEIREQVVQSN